MNDDERYMARALELAAKGKGRTAPNPCVGAVVVKNGAVIGEGWHRKAGAPHAEVEALGSCGESPVGATLYVTLEPCNHTGRTGPCAVAVKEAGIARVVIGSRDTSPKKGMRGAPYLRRAGIEVVTGVLKEACDEMVRDFLTLAGKGRPHVVMKCAVTLDGKVATKTGDSRWVTGPAARKRVHAMRNDADAVMIGVETALADDPALTVRHGSNRRNPLRIVVDSRLRIKPGSKLATDGAAPTLVATTDAAPKAKIARLRKAGVDVLVIPARKGKVALGPLMAELGQRNVMRLLVEGAGEMAGALMEQGLVDEVAFFIAPKIAGGPNATVTGGGVVKMADAWALSNVAVEFIDGDILVRGLVAR
ncbi:MAG: bifunctional diaminohydroxyphosphoribosylaminopyrimidine deaminase/5-amino-6-(5-phosphoribosylamino)uracil reductase RibD [Nitrospinae bacterium]|nr:bifunctional diaminohydroxyphosphoribosylaminopyrimidine deaminase/5-amino-6-(5-phosphoribosylamino)uracil reductase RibD [Nitrospinota bacterium]